MQLSSGFDTLLALTNVEQFVEKAVLGHPAGNKLSVAQGISQKVKGQVEEAAACLTTTKTSQIADPSIRGSPLGQRGG